MVAVKKVLALAGLGAGTVVVAQIHSSKLARATAPGPHASGDTTWEYFRDSLSTTADSVSNAAQHAVALLRSAKSAWQQRSDELSSAAEGGGRGGAASEPQAGSLTASVATFLALLAEGGDEGRPEEQHLLHLAGTRVLDWLLDAALEKPGSAEQQAVQRWLLAVLSDNQAAQLLLDRPGAAARLLQLAVRAPALCSALSQALRQGLPLPQTAEEVDIRAAVQVVAGQGHELRRLRRQQRREVQQVALQLLSGWAEASVLNCTHIVQAGAGPALTELAATTATGSNLDGIQLELASLMRTLALDCPHRSQLQMAGWLYHLLCLAADASASSNWALADAALGAFAACLRKGCELPQQLMRERVLPLLERLAAQPGSHMRPAIAAVVEAMAEGSGADLPQAERERWAETLLAWLVEAPSPPPTTSTSSSSGGSMKNSVTGGRPAFSAAQQQEREQMQCLVMALTALAAPSGAPGLHIAHSWLAELITHMSRQIQPYGSVAPPKPPAPAAAASGGRRWYQWYGRGSGSTEDGAGAAAAPAGAGQAAGGAAVGEAAGQAAGAAGEGEPAVGMGQGAPVVLPAGDSIAETPLITPEAEQALASAAQDEGAVLSGAAPPSTAAAASEDTSTSSSWWAWWPFGSAGGAGTGDASTGQGPAAAAAAAEGAAQRPSDPELSLYINAAPVGPLYARAVAAGLLEASGRVGAFQEPPPSAEELMSPAEVAAYPEVAAAIDLEVADKSLCQALKVLCALAAGGEPRRQWLLSAGILPLMRRLALEHAKDVSELTSSSDFFADVMPLCVKRQTVRLLAMLSTDLEGATAVQAAGWVPWLQDLALSADCKLSSSAARALLHVESSLAVHRRRRSLKHSFGLLPLPLPRAAPELLPDRSDAQPASGEEEESAASAAGGEGRKQGEEEESSPPELLLQEAQAALRGVKRKLGRQLDAVREPVPLPERLVLQDGVHLFDPLAPHHAVLAREGTGSTSSDAPLVDVVFVHGIRGGAFATWRREGVLQRGQAREALERNVCWPSSWIAADLPQARLISAEYAAPASGWEGESLSFRHTVAQLMDKLTAAGVGQRPVVFVCHSMGGLVVKEMLANAQRERDPRLQNLVSNAVGLVFYSVPHFGSKLADWGWQLRYIGASPARAVAQLKTGPHLEELNAAIRALCKSGRLPVLSFSEGQPTRLAYVRTHIVPHESAYPGYGDFVVLHEHDHINVCKPHDRADPAYARLLQFLQARLRDVRLRRAEEEQAAMDHMPPAAM